MYKGNKKSLILTILLVLGIAIYFWSSSRYPALNEKAMMGSETPVFGIGFDNYITLNGDEGLVEKTLINTANWAYTNKKGMLFGVLFASSIMLLFFQLTHLFSRNHFSNTFLGMMIGAPLGVCVNCAAPIAQGVKSSGGKTETALGMLFSSPTLNVIVLTMLFALFPFYMVVLKISFTLLIILGFIPLVSRFIFKEEVAFSSSNEIQHKVNKMLPKGLSITIPEKNSWLQALKWLMVSFLKCLWYILKTTVPLMLLAGFLGNVLITFFPFEKLVSVLPEFGWLKITVFTLIVAIIGTFLPVPIAFDVIITAILLATGMAEQYVIALLLSLGIYSIYAFFIVRQSISFKVALTFFIIIATTAWIFALGGNLYDDYLKEKKKKLYAKHLNHTGKTKTKILGIPAIKYPIPNQEEIKRLTQEKAPNKRLFSNQANLSVYGLEFLRTNETNQLYFERSEGMKWGINESPELDIYRFVEPMGSSSSISSGDIHQDGWTDILIGAHDGLKLYANMKGEGFKLQYLDTNLFKEQFISNAALVDFNNDGWLDIFYSVYRKGAYILYSTKGNFNLTTPFELPVPSDFFMNVATAFGDLNEDGILDILMGTNSIGQAYMGKYSLPCARNFVLLSSGLKDSVPEYKIAMLSGKAGESWTVLISDYNDDSNLDLICGNDFSIPDNFYLGNGNGDFNQLKISDSIVNLSTRLTMSISSADINNDLHTDLYIAGGSNVFLDPKDQVDADENLCDEIMDPIERKRCIERMEIHENLKWAKLKQEVFNCPPEYFEECLVFDLYNQYIRAPEKKKELRSFIKDGWGPLSDFVSFNLDEDSIAYSKESWNQEIPQMQARNVFQLGTSSKKFQEKAYEYGIEQVGWSWNCKFADFNNDEWQDLYVVNNTFHDFSRDDKFFYLNDSGKAFVDATEQVNLSSFLTISSYTYFDMDNDGDLDIISVPSQSPVLVYENKGNKGNAISFKLNDKVGNRFGIGSKVIIYYNNGKHQMREIQAGGGFKSFDHAVAWFGIGIHQKIDSVRVNWSTGVPTVIKEPFKANWNYTLEREKNSL